MKIIEQSHQLLPDQPDLIQQIGSRAAICYQADGDNPEANAKRVQHCLKNGHMSALEMGRTCVRNDDYLSSRFIELGATGGYLSGSVRAHLELGYDFEAIITWSQKQEPCPSFHPDYIYHKYQAVKFITNRAMSHELVRHRPCSFLQESQRYVRYDKPGGIEFIRPVQYDEWTGRQQDRFLHTCYDAEIYYRENLNPLDLSKMSPQEARNNLPNSCKTELIVYTSLAEWRHIFYQRSQGGADPQMKSLMLPVLQEFRQLYPNIFDNLTPSIAGR